MQAKKSLGQNFLMHQAIADRIADAATLSPDGIVLEIGPGTGMLTRALLARAGKVIAVEADGQLVTGLRVTFADELRSGRLELVPGDIRNFDFSTLPEVYSVVANIPYYITGEIIRLLLSTAHKPSTITLLVQKEVAERIARDKKESLLSLSVKAYGTPKYLFTVPRGAFRPAPNVDSAVLTIADIHSPFKNAAEEARFFDVLHAGFAHKRKRLAKNLEAVLSPEEVQGGFGRAGLAPNARAEDVPLAGWLTLSDSGRAT